MTIEVQVAHDPVLLTQSWLRTHLDSGVSVVKNRPNPVEGEFVTVRRTGAVPSLFVADAAWLSVEAFAPTDTAASDLGHLVWGLLHAMQGQVVDGVQCYRVQTLGGPADMPLAAAGDLQRPRFVMTAQVTFRTDVRHI